MTEDYKKILLDYITEMPIGTPTSEEIINSVKEIERSVWLPYIPEDWNDMRLKGAIKSKTSDKVVFYGGYVESGGTYSNNSRGIVIITDSNLYPLQTIYEFSSGTKLRPIECMIQEEDGQFVAIDSLTLYNPSNNNSRQQYQNCEKRFIMLNDISIPTDNNYNINLRRSFVLDNNYKNFVCKDIYKNPNSAHYLMAGTSIEGFNSIYAERYVKVIDLKVNVGSPNEWATSSTTTMYVYGGSYCYFDSDDNAQWKLLISPFSANDNTIRYWYGTNGTATNSWTIMTPSYKTYIDEATFECQSVFINENLCYFTTNNQQWGSGTIQAKYVGLYEYNFSTNEVKEIYLKHVGDYDYSYLDLIQLYAVNGELYIEYCTNVDNANKKADYYVQHFTGLWNPILIKANSNYIMTRRAFYVAQTFNILKMYCLPINPQISGFPLLEITEIYNLINYNGEPYENSTSLIPKYANIYSDNELVFSRNLHNFSITSNYSVASIEIPNTYLNGINLNPKDLVGETNYVLVEDGETITKNIYEVLYLNYINTISVIDNEEISQPNTSELINTSINDDETNQNNVKCSKVRINYDGISDEVFEIGWTRVDDTHAYTEFTIYVKAPIEKIELISNDETETYITITRELEEGKYYTFKQYLKVE